MDQYNFMHSDGWMSDYSCMSKSVRVPGGVSMLPDVFIDVEKSSE